MKSKSTISILQKIIWWILILVAFWMIFWVVIKGLEPLALTSESYLRCKGEYTEHGFVLPKDEHF